jgi:hypothetical protein
VTGCVLLMLIRPSDWDIKPSIPLVLFEQSRLIPALGFLFILPHLILITHTLQHNKHLNSDVPLRQLLKMLLFWNYITCPRYL